MGSRRSCPFRWSGISPPAMAWLTRLRAHSSTGSPVAETGCPEAELGAFSQIPRSRVSLLWPLPERVDTW